MSSLKARCERVRSEISLEAFFTHLGWEYREKGRLNCVWPDHEDRSPAMQVYPESGTVHCFACNQAGDIIKLVRRCVAPVDGAWSVEEALTWLEGTFGLTALPVAASARSRMHRKVAAWRRTLPSGSASPGVSRPRLIAEVVDVFRSVESGAPKHVLPIVRPHYDYVMDAAPQVAGDLIPWAAMARAHALGSYAAAIRSLSEAWEVPPDVIDDRPHVVREALAWDVHRGCEFSSPWPVYLLWSGSPSPVGR